MLTVTDPASCRVSGSKQLELGLQGPILHSGTVQPLQNLHKHFKEERGEASVLRDSTLWEQQPNVSTWAQGCTSLTWSSPGPRTGSPVPEPGPNTIPLATQKQVS